MLKETISRQLKLSPWVEQQKAALIQVTSKRTNINGVILMIIKMKQFFNEIYRIFPNTVVGSLMLEVMNKQEQKHFKQMNVR